MHSPLHFTSLFFQHTTAHLPSLWRRVISAVTLLICTHAHAITINFDDIERVNDPEYPSWADQPITDQYLSKGLLVDGGYLNSYFEDESHKRVSGPNYLQGGPFFGLKFVGDLPRFVSLVVTSSHEDVVFLSASCGDGSVLASETPGWAGPDKNSPFQAKNLITFSSTHGISHIDISAYYFLRNSAMVDDLIFHYSVPEPSALILILLGLLAIYCARMATRNSH